MVLARIPSHARQRCGLRALRQRSACRGVPLSAFLLVALCCTLALRPATGLVIPRLCVRLSSAIMAAASSSQGARASPAPFAPDEVLSLMKLCGRLKKTARTGWVRCGVRDYESVADHSWRMALMPLLFADAPDVDHVRCMKIGLVHDLAEALVGDITPHCGVSKEEKSRLEADAMQKISATMPGSTIAAEIVGLWEEYEAGRTREARLMKDLDKFEMIMQAEDYEEEQGVDLSQFFESTKGKIKDDVVSSWESELRSRRLRRLASGNLSPTLGESSPG